MSEHTAKVTWRRQTPDFRYATYNRAHDWRFDGGVVVPASASPAFKGDPERVDPEEAFVAALSSCHMLSFLAIAALKGFVVDSYDDDAFGVMTKNEQGHPWVSKVTLRPRVKFAADASPAPEQLAAMHHAAHEECFIALSVKTDVVVDVP
ncbi:MAG TPA: OsmC family protein [Polyangiaceae bacterium]|nr:OsmC family protein [Polyangiaceae bacterium]